MTLRIGTSGWSYKPWKGLFYDKDLPDKDMLLAYIKTFDTVEINNSFYSLPSEKAAKSWYDKTPPDFLFAIKASRFITHMKRLKDPQGSIIRFFASIQPLKDKIGPLLFQCPPRFKSDPLRLRDFMQAVPENYRYVFEFRDESWYSEEIYRILRDYNACLCFYDLDRYQSPETETADFIYLRLHGPEGKYQGSYDSETLTSYAYKIRKWQADSKDVYCYFDNDQKSNAPFDAQNLIAILNNYRCLGL